MAHRGAEIHEPVGGRRAAVGLCLRTGPPPAPRLLLPLAPARPRRGRRRARLRRHRHGRRALPRDGLRRGRRAGHRAAARPLPGDLAGRTGGAPPQGRGRRAAPLPPCRAAADPGEADRRDPKRDRRRREPDRRGPDRLRQDGGGASPGPGRGPRLRPAGRLPHLEDAAAEDGRLVAHRDERARVPDGPGPGQGADVRQRPDPLPRGILPVRQGLPGQDGEIGPPRPPSRGPFPPRPGNGLRGGAPRRSLPVRGSARARRSSRCHRGRLQLRLRARGRAAPPDGRRAEGRHPGHRRGAQPAGPRPADLLPGALRGDPFRPARAAPAAAGRPLRRPRDHGRGAARHRPRRRRRPAGGRSDRRGAGAGRADPAIFASTGSRSSCATSPGSARRASPSWTTR